VAGYFLPSPPGSESAQERRSLPRSGQGYVDELRGHISSVTLPDCCARHDDGLKLQALRPMHRGQEQRLGLGVDALVGLNRLRGGPAMVGRYARSS
jgi:hypothetical protein